jgi:hypothetical protein
MILSPWRLWKCLESHHSLVIIWISISMADPLPDSADELEYVWCPKNVGFGKCKAN